MPIDSPLEDSTVHSFVVGLPRICFTLALGHFLCIPAVYFYFVSESSLEPVNLQVLSILFGIGLLLAAIGFLDRYPKLRAALPFSCMALLIGQVTYFLARERHTVQPIIMIYPLLCSLGNPILGRRASYLMAVVSSFLICGYYFLVLEHPLERIPSLIMVHIVLFFSAHLSEELWNGIRRKERALRQAYERLAKKEREMENWVERLGKASSLINAGQFPTLLPQPPPSHVFVELTKSMEQMQDKLAQYFSNVLLKDRLSSIGVLATGVAHEMNTPLTTMQFALQLDKTIPEETRRLLKQEMDRLSSISKRLLSFAHPKGEQICDLNQLVRSAQSQLNLSRFSNLSVRVELSTQPLFIRCSPNHIEHCVLDLFQNAVDALEGISTPTIEVWTHEQEPGVIVFEFRDNGCGIEPELLNKVVEPFFSTKQPGKGTGLGLFVVHQILKEHEAAMQIESEPGKGTTVRMLFPKAAVETKEVKVA